MRENRNEQASELTEILTRFLDCPCRSFPPMADDKPILDAYREARERGRKEGFVPMLVTGDPILWESLLFNSDPDSNGIEASFQPERATRYRKEVLDAPLRSGQEVQAMFASKLSEWKEELEDGAQVDWDADILGEISGGEANDRFLGYWDFGSPRKTEPLILAEIPVKNPWEVFAYLPFGGWNECPDTAEQMAVAKYWFEQHGAVPAVLTHDVLEFSVPAPVSREQAMSLALEQYSFCTDVVDQGVGTVGTLADMLSKSTVWYFWWD